MGHPRTKAQLLAAQRGRFTEGSMNDRASAVPPFQFLGPAQQAALERPVHLESQSSFGSTIRDASSHRSRSEAASSEDGKPRRQGIFGLMWEGVRGKLGLGLGPRREDDREKAAAAAAAAPYEEENVGSSSPSRSLHTHVHARAYVNTDGKSQHAQGELPSRESVLASYHELVASGFFSAHATQSARYGPPPPSSSSAAAAAASRPQTSHGGATTSRQPPPQWPLTPLPMPTVDAPRPPPPCRASPSNMCSPASATSSRGTKRAADSPPGHEGRSPLDDDDEHDDEDEDEDESTLRHRFLPKRLRRAGGGGDISLPRLRSIASRKNMRSAVAAARRSLSTGAHYAQHGGGGGGGDVATQQQQQKESIKVVAGPPTPFPPRASAEYARAAAAAAAAAGGAGGSCWRPGESRDANRRMKRPISTRNLRHRAAATSLADRHQCQQPLSVVPDLNRGIPHVPSLPPKFTYGEDRENGSPWRGLRW
ncbi:hypothetical protein AAL_06704 [Moelleriella libera RCEF 2490]|uniref:Uncharacterized protein n=1 Tax=Moelleriella libera RCEF 2490 TaxID=1081109 RepID=A0A167YKM2_9HYPO|nr:hypothetical protein AAL_06704 [Moelleriella libera RCEF 2490]